MAEAQSKTSVRDGPLWISKLDGIASVNAGGQLHPDERERLVLEVSHHLQIDDIPDGAEIGSVAFYGDGTLEFTLKADVIERYGFDPTEGTVTQCIEG